MRIYVEYDILSATVTPSPRRKLDKVFDYSNTERYNSNIERYVNRSFSCSIRARASVDDDFDIISERDVSIDNYSCSEDLGGGGGMRRGDFPDGNHNIEYKNNMLLTLINWERRLTESINLYEKNETKNHEKCKKVKEKNKIRQLFNDYSNLVNKVVELENENTELKFLIHNMKLKNDEELNTLIQHLKDEEDTSQELIKNITVKELDSASKFCHEMNNDHFTDRSNSWNNENSIESSTSDDDEKSKTKTNVDECRVHDKSADEPDVIREYYWDEYLPISTKHFDINNNKNGGGGCGGSENDVIDDDDYSDDFNDDDDDDIRFFSRPTYDFRFTNTLILRSDPELYTKSDIEEDNEHFKDLNIRLIRENEELDGCLQILQVQVKNLKKIQSVLLDQLVKRAPTCMREMLEQASDEKSNSHEEGEEDISLCKTRLGAIFDEMINLNDEQHNQIFSQSNEDYSLTLPLLYQ